MKKRNKNLTLLLVIMLIFCLLFVIACKPPVIEEPDDDDSDITVTDDMLIKNGTFYSGTNSTGSNTYLKDTVNGWTKTNAASYYSNATMGVIDLDKAKFDANNTDIYEKGLDYPGIAPNTPQVEDENGKMTNKDTNALIIGLPQDKGSVYYKTTSAVTLTANKYYKLSIDVYTNLIDKENELQGAWIIINNGAYTEFASIDTNKEWKTYDIYIAANNFENRTIYVELWLGHGPRYIGTQTEANTNPRITKGFALFDNVILDEIEKSAYTEKQSVNGEGIVGSTSVINLDYPDKGFTYETKYSFISPSSTTSKVYYSAKVGAANNYKQIVGKEDAETYNDFPGYSSASATTGIFDMSKLYNPVYKLDDDKNPTEEIDKMEDAYNLLNSDFHAPNVADFYRDGKFQLSGNRSSEQLKETRSLLIYHPNYAASGLGYKSNTAFLVEKDKFYTVSVWAYVWVPEFGITEPTAPKELEIDKLEKPNPEDEKYGDDGEESPDYIKDLADYNANKAKWDDYDKEVEKYNTQKAEWEDQRDKYNEYAGRASAMFKMSGVSIEEGSLVENTDVGITGQWQKLTFNIKGNELSDRKVFFEFWYGEGEWQSNDLMVGGAIFDNISIEVSDTAKPLIAYETLSPLTEDEIDQFGFLDNINEDFVEIDNTGMWEFDFIDKKSDKDNAISGIVQGAAANDEIKWNALFAELGMPSALSITKDGIKKPFNVLMLYNKEYTATTLTYKTEDKDREIIINPNSFYRLSMWVKTDGVDKGMGLNINLNDDKDASLTNLNNINTNGEWQEISIFVRGSSISKSHAYIKYQLGAGDVYTPESHIKGVAYITAVTFKSINYTEFNSASTGTYVAKKTISDTPSTSNSITNGYFAELGTTNFDSKDKIFDEEGKLIGVAEPASWTLSAAANALSTPKNLKINDGKLTWDLVERAEKYYVYLDNIKVDDGTNGVTTKNNVLIAIVDQNEYTISVFRNGSFKVRAVRLNVDDDGAVGISAYSNALKNTLTTGNQEYDESLKDQDLKTEFGIIDYKNYPHLADKAGLDSTANDWRTSFYSGDELKYISTKSNQLLMLSSNYYTRGGYTASSTSLSANTYYMLGVWVKTIDGARASVTIKNTSKVFARTEYEGENYDVEGDYVGYVNIDTKGEWIQYRFYVKTTVSSATLQLELSLGNKYAVSTKIPYEPGESGYDEKNPSKVKETITNGLSKGTVFFDDVSFRTLESVEDYNKLVYGGQPADMEDADKLQENKYGEDNLPEYTLDQLTDNFYKNRYIFKVLDYTTDSFDIFTDAEEGSVQGAEPKDYTHYVSTAATDYDSKSEEPAMLYGVYDKRRINEGKELLETIVGSSTFNDGNWISDDTEKVREKVDAFLTTDSNMGNNFLLLANLTNNGQYYLTNTSITLSDKSYYKISFFAKTLIPSGKYGEFRFEYGDDTTKHSAIRITSEDKNDDGMHEYSFYVYNNRESSVSGNKISFYLGSNTNTATDAAPTNFFKGLMIIDNISVIKVNDEEVFTDAKDAYEKLSADDKLSASFNVHTFEKVEDEGGDEEEPPAGKEKEKINSQLWLIVSSVVIGAVLLATIVILSWRKLQKKIDRKRKPTKVESNVPVNLEAKEDKKAKVKNKKKDIKVDEEFND